jgi:hypothetical protein
MPMRELSKNELAEMVSAMKRPDKLDPLPAGFYPMPLALSQDDPEWRVIGLVTNGHSPREALPYRESARSPQWSRFQGKPVYLFPMTLREARALRDHLSAAINDMESRLGLDSPDDTTTDTN